MRVLMVIETWHHLLCPTGVRTHNLQRAPPPLLAIGIVTWPLRNLISPTRSLRDLFVLEIWRLVAREVILDSLGSARLYFLVSGAIARACVAASILTCILTCCLVPLPDIGTVLLLPLSVFERCHTLYFLEQFGKRWRFFEAPSEPVPDVA